MLKPASKVRAVFIRDVVQHKLTLSVTEEELNKEIITHFKKVKYSNSKNASLLHLKSISNFIEHLISPVGSNVSYSKNSNIKKLGVLRKKKLLLNYLKEVENTRTFSDEFSKELFINYVNPIGTFMTRFFGFSYLAPGSIFLKLLILLAPFIILDYFIQAVYGSTIFVSALALMIFIARYILKVQRRKVFGYKW